MKTTEVRTVETVYMMAKYTEHCNIMHIVRHIMLLISWNGNPIVDNTEIP